MAYSESLAVRVRDVLARRRGVDEKKMFGGVAFLLNGNLLVCVWKDLLIVRLGLDAGDAALREPHVRPFDVTGKPMKGWAMIESDGIDTDEQLKGWIERAWEFVVELPAK